MMLDDMAVGHNLVALATIVQMTQLVFVGLALRSVCILQQPVTHPRS